MNAFLNPNGVINLLPLKEGMVVADFGCGNGYFTLEIAKRLKPNGKVLALDIWKPSLEALNFRAKLEGVNTLIETHWANLEMPKGSGLPNNSCDLVFIANILFEIEKKELIFEEAKRVLRPEGFLVIIEWEPDKLPNKNFLSPLSKQETLIFLEKFGFKVERELSLSLTHYGFLAKLTTN
ncbi:MAG: class I SAM-dependent methyltransferase [Minisyncoccia bacterium]